MKKILMMIVLGLGSSVAFAADDGHTGFDVADSDKDGAVTREEAASFSALEQNFDSVDANNNGLIEIDEYHQIAVQEQEDHKEHEDH